jgi:hypothetical protein
MRARFRGTCPSCDTEIEPGQEVSKLLGKWLHIDCKYADIAERKVDFGPPVELPPDESHNESITYVGTRHWRRRNQRFLKRANPR